MKHYFFIPSFFLHYHKKMRKITSRHEKEKKIKSKQLLVGGILILIITASTLAYSFIFSEKDEEGFSKSKIIYSGLEFTEKNEFWFTEISNFQFSFKYNPQEVEDVKISYITKTINDYYRKPLYINSESMEAEYEIYRNLDQFILRRQYACLENQTCEKEFPVKTCKDNFIIIEEKNESKITQEENCIFIQGKKEDLTKLTDKFLFRILGVQ